MRQAWIAVTAGLWLLNPCSKKDSGAAAEDAAPGKGMAEPDASSVAVDPASVREPAAKNSSRIARFPNDPKLGNVKEKLKADHTYAREAPGTGALVAALTKDVEVTKVAQHEDYFLVTFADPKDASTTLMGWIPQSGFSPTPPAPKKACPKGQVKFEGVGCKVECSSDEKCPAGMACTGMGARPEISDGAFAYCEPATDGGAPTATDAGAPRPPKDAGAPAPRDAGPPPAPNDGRK
jgi:hypothetical protein